MGEKDINIQQDDERLAATAKSDPTAAAELISRVLPSIRQLSRKFAPDVSEDMFQEGMLAALSAISSYDEKRQASVRTYLYACARNRMLTAVKKQRLSQSEQDSSDSIADETAADRERFADLYAAIESCLTRMERQVVLCYLEGLSYREIASVMKISDKAVDNAMQRARKKLRKEFDSNS